MARLTLSAREREALDRLLWAYLATDETDPDRPALLAIQYRLRQLAPRKAIPLLKPKRRSGEPPMRPTTAECYRLTGHAQVPGTASCACGRVRPGV